MKGKVPVAAALVVLAAAGLALLLLSYQRGAAQEASVAAQKPTLVGLDTDTEGNSAASLGVIDSCVSVDVGELFPVDIYVGNVSNLLGWEVYLRYDQSRLEIVHSDVRLFLSSRTGSNVIDVSDPLPNRSGLYRLAAADIASPAALESGSGVLARLVLQAKEAGGSPVSLPYLDFNTDGTYDLGPRLIGPSGLEMGDADGDGFFDGPIDTARVVVGSSCDGDDGDDSDGDGVTDVVDKCPGTASGAPVDTNGCSDSRVDKDGDGVCNPDAPSGGPSGCTGSDQCPGTPAAASVDASGCSLTQLEQLKKEAKERLIETATAYLNLDASLDTVTVGGSTDILAVFADENGEPVPGVDITFKIDQQPGSNADLDGEASVTKTSDTDGIAEAKLNVGDTPGKIVVSATAEGETETITITVEAGRTGADTSPTNSTPTTTATPSGQGGATETPAAGGAGLDTAGDDSDGGGIGAWIAAPIAAGVLALLAAGYIAFRRIRKRAT